VFVQTLFIRLRLQMLVRAVWLAFVAMCRIFATIRPQDVSPWFAFLGPR
jgi:hypothetical protein